MTRTRVKATHSLRCYRKESRALLLFSLFLSLFSRIAHISISIYPSYILRSIVCVMFDRTYLLRINFGLRIKYHLIPSTVLRPIILHYDLSINF